MRERLDMDGGSRRRIVSFEGRVEAHTITVESPGSGAIEDVLVVEGQAVVHREPIIELDHDDLYGKVSAAVARLADARARLGRQAPAGTAEALLHRKGMAAAEKLAQRDYEEAFSAAWQATIRAPARGRVSAIHVTTGAEIVRSQPLVTIVVAKPSRVVVRGPLDAGALRASRSVTVVLEDGTRCGAAVDPYAPRAGGVALTVDDPGITLLRPGMRVRVDVELDPAFGGAG